MDVPQLIRDIFPVGSGRASLELVDVDVQDNGAMTATVRLVVWEGDGEARTIRDIKEQQVWLGTVAGLDQPRLPACLQGWSLAVAHLCAQDDTEWLDCLMPHDLMPSFVRLLELKRPSDADDFAEALLGSKQRFGQWLRS